MAHAQRFVSKAMAHLVYNTHATLAALRGSQQPVVNSGEEDKLLLLHQCPQLNVSVCEYSTKMSQRQEAFLVALYNPLAYPTKRPVRVPIVANRSVEWHVEGAHVTFFSVAGVRAADSSQTNTKIEPGKPSCAGPDGHQVRSQVVSVSALTKSVQKTLHENGALPKLVHAAGEELSFVADVPALGHATFLVSPKGPSSAAAAASEVWDSTTDARWNRTSDELSNDEVLRFGNGAMEAAISPQDGRMTLLSKP